MIKNKESYLNTNQLKQYIHQFFNNPLTVILENTDSIRILIYIKNKVIDYILICNPNKISKENIEELKGQLKYD